MLNVTKKSQMAGVCGIFCGDCPQYPQECHGCLSDHVAAHCKVCPNGFRHCAAQKDVVWCFQCAEFPCTRLKAFLNTHWENGISHHAECIVRLQRMRDVGVEAVVNEAFTKATCPQCGKVLPWNNPACSCGNHKNCKQRL